MGDARPTSGSIARVFPSAGWFAVWLLSATPPPTPASPLPSPLVDATAAVPGLVLDLRYATPHNLVGEALYTNARCLLLPQTAAALAHAQALLQKQGLTLVAWDCYRPRGVQWALWKKQPTPGLVANPARGSNHNRGAAVDVSLQRLDGGAVELPTDFDDLSPQAASAATEGVSEVAQHNRRILKAAMRAAGFTSIRREWWHFDLVGALSLPVLNDEL